MAHLDTGDPRSSTAAAEQLNGFDVVVLQHEYGIYGGPQVATCSTWSIS